MSRRDAALIAILAAACTKDPALVETPIDIAFPPDDDDARTRLATLEIEVWPVTAGTCRDLGNWRRAVCGGQEGCGVAPSPRTRGETPEANTTITRNGDGTWSTTRLPALSGGPWEVAVRGLDDAGEVFIYGCRTVSSGMPWNVGLWRPWCEAAACAGQFHPACDVKVDCEGSPNEDDPEGLKPPVCELDGDKTVWAWEQRGVPCPPRGLYHGACAMAVITCERGMLAPRIDGICPQEEPAACGDNLEDLNCDGIVPGPCGTCDGANEPERECRSDLGPDCVGTTTCEGGRWSECVFTSGSLELCDGVNSDCDGSQDDTDPDALAACNAGRPRTHPAADACTVRGQCMCGVIAACPERTYCRGSQCLPYDDLGMDAGAPDAPPSIGDASLDARPEPDAETGADAGIPPDAVDSRDTGERRG